MRAALVALVCFAAACGGVVGPNEAGDGGSTNSGTNASSAPVSEVGATCTTDRDCLNPNDADLGLTCHSQHNDIDFPGGDCTASCTSTSACPGTNVVCGASDYDLGDAASCMTTCASDSDCRAGFTCLTVQTLPSGTAHGCWSRPSH